MQHSKSDVFQRHYLPRYISADTQAAYRGMAPQSAVMRAVSGMRRSIDPRRPRKLTAEQSAGIKRHPRVVELYDRKSEIIRDLTKATRKKTSLAVISRLRSAKRNATLAYQKEKRRQREALLENIKKEFDRDQAVADIQNQLHNRPVDAARQTLDSHLSPRRTRVCQTLFTFPASTVGKEKHRITCAVASLIDLCGAQNNGLRYFEPQNCFPEKSYRRNNHTTVDLERSLVKSGGPHLHQCKRTQCFLCLRDRELSTQERRKEFYSRKDLEKHLNRHHFRFVPEKAVTICPMDGQKLLGYSELVTHWRLSH